MRRLNPAQQTKRNKAERLKYSPSEVFKRPGESEKWSAWDQDGVPIQAAGDPEPLSKAAYKKLKKEWEKHKEEWEKASSASKGDSA